MSTSFFGQITKKELCLVHEKLQRNHLIGSGLKIFIFRPDGFDYIFGIFDKHPKGRDEVKNSMGLD